MLQNEGLKEKNLECCYFVFILDFINFVGFLYRCDEINFCSMQSFVENKGYLDWWDLGLDMVCKRWIVLYQCFLLR